MKQTSEIKNKVIVAVITIIMLIAGFIINKLPIEFHEKVIGSVFCIILILIVPFLNNLFSFNRIDIKTYETMKQDLSKIGRTLDNIQENNSNVSKLEVYEFYDFSRYYYQKRTVVGFSNIWAKRKLKALCISLAKLENFIDNNHIDNAGGLTMRIRFTGSTSGVYDHSKHDTEEENKRKYIKLFKTTLKHYIDFKNYCEKRL
ncbi:hypothetical protein AABD34_00160 [Staphylococcus saprophyticus]|uniref:hypothetical protein n=1 Tax=Staphylococcus saprophyticus TaxID=29385 RepID=UPI00398AC4D6